MTFNLLPPFPFRILFFDVNISPSINYEIIFNNNVPFILAFKYIVFFVLKNTLCFFTK